MAPAASSAIANASFPTSHFSRGAVLAAEPARSACPTLLRVSASRANLHDTAVALGAPRAEHVADHRTRCSAWRRAAEESWKRPAGCWGTLPRVLTQVTAFLIHCRRLCTSSGVENQIPSIARKTAWTGYLARRCMFVREVVRGGTPTSRPQVQARVVEHSQNPRVGWSLRRQMLVSEAGAGGV